MQSIEQVKVYFDIYAAKMAALSNEAVRKMESELPDEVLDMPLGKFYERAGAVSDADAPNNFKRLYGDKLFEFSDQYELLGATRAVDD